MKYLIILLIFASCQQNNVAPQSIITTEDDTIRFVGTSIECLTPDKNNFNMMLYKGTEWGADSLRTLIYGSHSANGYKLGEFYEIIDPRFKYVGHEVRIPNDFYIYINKDNSVFITKKCLEYKGIRIN